MNSVIRLILRAVVNFVWLPHLIWLFVELDYQHMVIVRFLSLVLVYGTVWNLRRQLTFSKLVLKYFSSLALLLNLSHYFVHCIRSLLLLLIFCINPHELHSILGSFRPAVLCIRGPHLLLSSRVRQLIPASSQATRQGLALLMLCRLHLV